MDTHRYRLYLRKSAKQDDVSHLQANLEAQGVAVHILSERIECMAPIPLERMATILVPWLNGVLAAWHPLVPSHSEHQS